MPEQPQSLAQRIASMIEAEKPGPKEEPEPPPLSYSYPGAAKATGLGVSTLRREARAGRLKVSKVRGRVVITADELRRYLAAHTNG